jgi:hypothetical protein
MTGDTNDMLSRLRTVLPSRWFADKAPILDGLLIGPAFIWSVLYNGILYAKRQTRLGTASDSFLDTISSDYLGALLPRRNTEPDSSFRMRIQRELMRERNTRQAVISVLSDLTGRTPLVFEPARPADTGAYNGPLGYGQAGGWGSLMLPFQCFVTAYRAGGGGITNISGYGQSAGAYGVGAIQYASLSMLTGEITDTDITNAVTRVMPVSAIAWIRISN